MGCLESGRARLAESQLHHVSRLHPAKLYGMRAIEDAAERDRLYRPVPKDYESRMSNELKTLLEFGRFRADNLARLKDTCVALAIEPSLTRYGWIRAEA